MTHYFKYGEKEINYLKSKDPKLEKAINEIGFIKREIEPNLFKSIVRSIVGQQISRAVQDSIMDKFTKAFPSFKPIDFISLNDDDLRSFGLSYRKVNYIKEFSKKVFSGKLNLDILKTLSDNDVIKELTSLKGIGPWTAEMTLLFSLNRMNVFSFGDLAIKRGLQRLHGYEEMTKDIFERYRELYSPYASVASLYLWELSR